MSVETRNSGTFTGRLRCNRCAKLFREGIVTRGDDGNWVCECKAQAWYATRATVFEWIAFKLGLFVKLDFSELSMVDAQLGGTIESLKREHVKLEEARNQ